MSALTVISFLLSKNTKKRYRDDFGWQEIFKISIHYLSTVKQFSWHLMSSTCNNCVLNGGIIPRESWQSSCYATCWWAFSCATKSDWRLKTHLSSNINKSFDEDEKLRYGRSSTKTFATLGEHGTLQHEQLLCTKKLLHDIEFSCFIAVGWWNDATLIESDWVVSGQRCSSHLATYWNSKRPEVIDNI